MTASLALVVLPACSPDENDAAADADGSGDTGTAAAADATATDITAPDSERPDDRLFASTITGKVLVVDRHSLAKLGTISAGHTVTHGVAVLPGQQAIYYGNRDTDTIDRIELSADGSSGEITASAAVSATIKRVVGAADGSRIAATSESLTLPFDDFVHLFAPGDEGHVTTWSIPAPEPAVDGEGKLLRACPCVRPGVVLSPDGARAWVTHLHGHTVHVLKLDGEQPELEATVAVTALPGTPSHWLGPSAMAETSRDGQQVAIAGYESQTVLLLSADDPGQRRVIELPGELPADAAFTADAVWVLTVDEAPVQAEEVANAAIPTRAHRIRLSDLQIETTVSESAASIHVAVPPSGDIVYLGGSFSMLSARDAVTGALLVTTTFASAPMPLMGLAF